MISLWKWSFTRAGSLEIQSLNRLLPMWHRRSSTRRPISSTLKTSRRRKKRRSWWRRLSNDFKKKTHRAWTQSSCRSDMTLLMYSKSIRGSRTSQISHMRAISWSMRLYRLSREVEMTLKGLRSFTRGFLTTWCIRISNTSLEISAR